MTDNKRTRGRNKNAIYCTVPESYVLKTAIKALEKQISKNPFFVDLKTTIINALEKQIPKKPSFVGDGYDDEGDLIYDTWVCPSCETSFEFDYDDYDFCPHCGQKIDWSEEKADED